MNCRLCGSETSPVATTKLLQKYDIKLNLCPRCDLLQTDTPFWLEEAYSSPINIVDTGVLARNIYFANKITPLLYHFFPYKSIYLDFAGGYGLFVRLMRDKGFDFWWSDAYAQNLVARGFEKMDGAKYCVVTCFEYFEHSSFPLADFEKLFALGENIIISTTLRPEKVPGEDWWYYGQEHGQHIAFYSTKTLEHVAMYFGKTLITDGQSFHCFLSNSVDLEGFREVMFTGKLKGKRALKTLKKEGQMTIKELLKYSFNKFSIEAASHVHLESRTWSDHVLLKE